MTILRPVLSVSALNKRARGPNSKSDGNTKQEAADWFWEWAEERISIHTDRLCEKSVEEITRAVRTWSADDERMQLILTQSAVTLDALSPFDKLESAMVQAGILPVRIQGSASPSSASVESSIIAAAVGVTGFTAHAESCSGEVSLRGLDASLLEELPVRRDLVVIIEDGDSLDKELLFKIVSVVFNLRRRLRRISVVLETNLRDSLIAEAIDDENIFIGLAVSTIPLLDARELCARIRSIFFGNAAEVLLRDLPMALNDQDAEFLTRDLLQMTNSPLDVCAHVLEVVVNWFRKSPSAVLVAASASPTADLGGLVKEMSREVIASEFKGKSGPAEFAQAVTQLVLTRRQLAVVARVMENVCRAVGCPLGLPTVKDATCVLAEDRGRAVEKALMEIQARFKAAEFESMVSSTVAANEELVAELTKSFGVPRNADIVQAIQGLNKTVAELGKRKFMQSKLADDFFSALTSFVQSQLPETSECVLKALRLIQAPPTSDLNGKLTDVAHFEPTLAFLRADTQEILKNPKVDQSLKELFETARLVYGGTKIERKKSGPKQAAAKSIDLEVVTAELRKGDFELAGSLAGLELIGLLRQPGAVDFAYNSKVKLRRVYKDTPLFPTTPSEDEDE